MLVVQSVCFIPNVVHNTILDGLKKTKKRVISDHTTYTIGENDGSVHSIYRTNLSENEIKMSIFFKKNKPLATVLVVDERKAQQFGSALKLKHFSMIFSIYLSETSFSILGNFRILAIYMRFVCIYYNVLYFCRYILKPCFNQSI